MSSEQELVGVGQGFLTKHQVRFVAYQGERPVVQWSGDWNCADSLRAGANLQPESRLVAPPAPDNLIHAVMDIVQAPACFSKPITQKKPFKPPFKIRLDLQYTGELQLPVKLEAFALSEQTVDQLLKGQQQGCCSVPSLQQSQQHELENSSISCCIQTHNAVVGQGEQVHVEDFEFTDLRFHKSSRMNRRWILFSCRLGRDVMYVLYKLPTIVLSRKTDQYDKACGILLRKGTSNSLAIVDYKLDGSSPRSEGQALNKSRSNGYQDVSCSAEEAGTCINYQRPHRVHDPCTITQETVREWIKSKYAATGLERCLTDHDLVYLESKAGLRSHMNANQGEPLCVVTDLQAWHNFQRWFNLCLRSLKQEASLWCPEDIRRVCSFTVDRPAAEDLLRDEPPGTFIVRLCSEPGNFVISTQVQKMLQSEVNHFLVDTLDLQRQGLEQWIGLNKLAETLLDVRTGKRIPKSVAFPGCQGAIAPVSNVPSPWSMGSPQLAPVPPHIPQTTSLPPQPPSGLAPPPVHYPVPCTRSRSCMLPTPGMQTAPPPLHCSQSLSRSNSQALTSLHDLSSDCSARLLVQDAVLQERAKRPTLEDVLRLAQECGVDVSDQLGHLKKPTRDDLERLAHECGIDLNDPLLQHPPPMAAGVMFRRRSTASTATGLDVALEPSPKRQRLGSGDPGGMMHLVAHDIPQMNRL